MEMKYEDDAPIFNAIGVKEINKYLQKEIDKDEAKDLIKFRTHQYAKKTNYMAKTSDDFLEKLHARIR